MTNAAKTPNLDVYDVLDLLKKLVDESSPQDREAMLRFNLGAFASLSAIGGDEVIFIGRVLGRITDLVTVTVTNEAINELKGA